MSNTKGKVRQFMLNESEYAVLTDAYSGICLACGVATIGGIEPDARGYPCRNCGARKVYGCEELLIMGVVSFKD
jgi:hypothetical protein